VTVVDIGGGTVDLVTYRIIKLQPLQLEEACVGEGKKCHLRSRRLLTSAAGAKIGGTAIDRALHELMYKRFDAAFMNLPSEKKGAGSNFLKSFEEVKRNFKGKDKSKKILRLSLKMSKMDEESGVVQEYYDSLEDEVKVTRYTTRSFRPIGRASFIETRLTTTQRRRGGYVRATSSGQLRSGPKTGQ
jgi:hypothetical protein